MNKAATLALLLVALAPLSAAEWERWSAEIFGGTAHSFDTPLSIHQKGYPDIDLTADWETQAFEGSPYYVYRLGRWNEGRAWELEMIHHKLILKNNPPEVEHFEISHGYNMVLLNRATPWKEWLLRWGVGLVVTHPEGRIRGVDGVSGPSFKTAGAAVQGSAGRRFHVFGPVFAALELKLTAAYARTLTPGGVSDVPNVAVHALFGAGIGPRRKP